MSIDAIDHCTIICADLEASRRFYVEALGLTDGERPAFDFPGAWLYAGDSPVVHLVGGRARGEHGTGTIDHVAFRGGEIEEMRTRLTRFGAAFTEREVPGFALTQIFVNDPDGVTIEINYRATGG